MSPKSRCCRPPELFPAGPRSAGPRGQPRPRAEPVPAPGSVALSDSARRCRAHPMLPFIVCSHKPNSSSAPSVTQGKPPPLPPGARCAAQALPATRSRPVRALPCSLRSGNHPQPRPRPAPAPGESPSEPEQLLGAGGVSHGQHGCGSRTSPPASSRPLQLQDFLALVCYRKRSPRSHHVRDLMVGTKQLSIIYLQSFNIPRRRDFSTFIHFTFLRLPAANSLLVFPRGAAFPPLCANPIPESWLLF